MKPEELFAELKNGELRPFYYLYGEEDLLKTESFARLKEAALQGGIPDFNFDQFYYGDADVSKLVSAASTLPVMSPKRLVVLRDAEKLKGDEQEMLLAYLANPSPSTTMVFVGRSADKRKKFFSTISKAGGLVEHSHPHEREMPKWIRWLAKKKGVEVSGAAARYLVEIIGNDLTSISSEVEKLSLYVGDSKRIELEDVEAVTVDSRTRTVFQLTDAIATKNLKDSLIYLKKLLEGGESPIMIISMIVRQLRLIWTGVSMKNRGAGEDEIRKRISLPPFIFKSYLRQVKFFREDELAKAYENLFELDVKFKSTRIDKERALELFMFQVCK
ncbi:MAG: DNA polymerase III subunit delta [Proteobacteria bacterium]|nr:DNA polymerase III subunit delta [Pseudomonadota bacterium]